MSNSIPATGSRRVEYIRLDEIEGAESNPKQHDTTGIKRSIAHHGLAELPLRDDRTGRLVAGHGRLEQLREMHTAGKAAPEGVQVDTDGMWKMPLIAGWASRSDDDADAYLIASNKLTEAGGWDEFGLAEMLDELADAQMLELTGFDTDELDDLRAALEEADHPAPSTPSPAAQRGEDDYDTAGAPPRDPAERRDSDGTSGSQSTSLADRGSAYANVGTHTVMLVYPNDLFQWVVRHLAAIGADRDCDSNADAVVSLISGAVHEDPPAPSDSE